MERADVGLVLVDFDDTLVDTAPRFQNARRSLFALLCSLGAEKSHVHRVHHEQVEALMLERHGLGPARLEHSFRHTYEVVSQELGWPLSAELADRCAALGKAVAGAPPLIAGALDALQRLARVFPTVVYTQAADRVYQMSCIAAAGVHDVVGQERVVVCERKTAAAFQQALSDFRVENPGSAWMIGNSIRSDINPALEVGARAILVEVNEPWEFDIVEPISNDFVRVASFPHAVDYLFALGARSERQTRSAG